MQSNKDSEDKDEYISLWDSLMRWDSQSAAGKIKWAVYLTCLVLLFFVVMPQLLAPLFKDALPLVAIIYFVVIGIIQVVGNKLKVKVNREKSHNFK